MGMNQTEVNTAG